MIEIEFILYVSDQARSRVFYEKVLGQSPSLDVPGMTEFDLGGRCKLGLMPENGIAKIVTPAMRHPKEGAGIPRCELYLVVEQAKAYCDRAILAGAVEVSPLMPRDWGDTAGYFADLDGHVIAFAERGITTS